MNDLNRPSQDTGDVRKVVAETQYATIPDEDFYQVAQDFDTMLTEVSGDTQFADVVAQNPYPVENFTIKKGSGNIWRDTWDELQQSVGFTASLAWAGLNYLDDIKAGLLYNLLNEDENGNPFEEVSRVTKDYAFNLKDSMEKGDFKLDLTDPANRPSMKVIRRNFWGEEPDNPDGTYSTKPTLSQEFAAFGLDLALGMLTLTAPLSVAKRGINFTKSLTKVVKKLAKEEGQPLSKELIKKLAAAADEDLTKLMERHEAGDADATQQLYDYVTDSSILEVIGESYGRKLAQENFPERFARMGSSDILNYRKKSIEAIESLYEKGSPQLAYKELNNDFISAAHKHYYQAFFAKRYMDINDIEDMTKFLKDMTEDSQKFLEKAFINAAKNKNLRTLKSLNDMLSVQKDVLISMIGSRDIIKPLDNVEAFTLNKTLNLIHHAMEAMVRNEEYAFSSGVDMLRFWKLLGLRQQIISELTGKPQNLTPVLSRLFTGYDDTPAALRALFLKRAAKAAPGISPKKASILGEAVTEDKRAWQATADEMLKTYEILDNIAKRKKGLARKAVQAAKEAHIHFSDMDPKEFFEQFVKFKADVGTYGEAIGYMFQAFDDAHKINKHLNDMMKLSKWDKIYDRFVTNLLYPVTIHATNFMTNATMVLKQPVADLGAAVWAMFKGDADLAFANMSKSVARFIGYSMAIKDMTKLAGHYILAESPEIIQNLNKTTKALAEGNFRLQTMRRFKEYKMGQEVMDPTLYFSKETLGNLDPNTRAMYYMSRLYHAPPILMVNSDMTFKALVNAGERYSQAWFDAWTRASSWEEARRLFHINMSTSEEIALSAWKTAEASTFTEELTTSQEKLSAFIRAIPGSRWVIPFIKTPFNVSRSMFELTPGINLIPVIADKVSRVLGKRPRWITNNKTVKLLNGTAAERQTAIGTLTFTNGLFAALMFTPTEGYISGSGGLPMPNNRNIPYEPYTIFLPNGEKFYYGDNIVLKALIGLPISLKEAMHQVDWTDDNVAEDFEALAHAGALVLADMFSGSFGYRTAARYFKAVDALVYNQDPSFFLYEAMRIGMATMIPGAARDVVKYLDPPLREYENAFQRLASKYGLGSLVYKNPVHMDLFGGIRYQNLWSHEPEVVNYRGNEPWIREIRRIRPNLRGVATETSEFIVGNNPFEKRKYSLAEKAMMNRFYIEGVNMPEGPFREAVKSLMASEAYLLANPEQRKALLEELDTRYRRRAEMLLYQMYGNSLSGE